APNVPRGAGRDCGGGGGMKTVPGSTPRVTTLFPSQPLQVKKHHLLDPRLLAHDGDGAVVGQEGATAIAANGQLRTLCPARRGPDGQPAGAVFARGQASAVWRKHEVAHRGREAGQLGDSLARGDVPYLNGDPLPVPDHASGQGLTVR